MSKNENTVNDLINDAIEASFKFEELMDKIDFDSYRYKETDKKKFDKFLENVDFETASFNNPHSPKNHSNKQNKCITPYDIYRYKADEALTCVESVLDKADKLKKQKRLSTDDECSRKLIFILFRMHRMHRMHCGCHFINQIIIYCTLINHDNLSFIVI